MDAIQQFLDRDTAVTAATVMPAAYTLIFLESTLLAIIVAITCFAGAATALEVGAEKYGWTRFEFTKTLRPYVGSAIRRIRAGIRRA